MLAAVFVILAFIDTAITGYLLATFRQYRAALELLQLTMSERSLDLTNE